MLYITGENSDNVVSIQSQRSAPQRVELKVSGTAKLVLMILAGIVGIYIAYKLLLGLISTVLSLVLPLAIVLGVGYVIYLAIDRKAIGGGRRRFLP